MSGVFSDIRASEGYVESGNRLLDSLPVDARNALRPLLRIETLAVQDVLAESGARADEVYFPPIVRLMGLQNTPDDPDPEAESAYMRMGQ